METSININCMESVKFNIKIEVVSLDNFKMDKKTDLVIKN